MNEAQSLLCLFCEFSQEHIKGLRRTCTILLCTLKSIFQIGFVKAATGLNLSCSQSIHFGYFKSEGP